MITFQETKLLSNAIMDVKLDTVFKDGTLSGSQEVGVAFTQSSRV